MVKSFYLEQVIKHKDQFEESEFMVAKDRLKKVIFKPNKYVLNKRRKLQRNNECVG